MFNLIAFRHPANCRLMERLFSRLFSSRTAGVATITPATPVDHPLADKYGRFHNYIRFSVVEKCNLACRYCVADEKIELSNNDKLLTADEISRLAEVFVRLGVTKIRLTGGEPTIRSDLDEIIKKLNKLRPMGLKEIGLTTNGIVLSRRLSSYKAAGLDSVNISLDTLLPDKFAYITGYNGLHHVLKGIFSAIKMNYHPVKVNVVVMAGVNENEISNFVEMTRENPLDIRFLEFMPFGGNKWSRDKMVPYSEMLASVRKRYSNLHPVGNMPNDTAKSFCVPGYVGQIGFITSMSKNFCGSCNRLRVTADGNLKACLFGVNEVNLRESLRSGISDMQLESIIYTAVKRKAPKHGEIHQHVFHKTRLLSAGRNKTKLFQYNNNCANPQRYQFSTLSSSSSSSSQDFIQIDAVKMATVAGKPPAHRIARAVATVCLPRATLNMIIDGRLPKIVSLETLVTVVQLAGINAAKKTTDLLPLCHPIPISVVDVRVSMNKSASSFRIESFVVSDNAVTGVEMEALVAANIAALTLYDLAKSAGSQNIVISNVKLLEKRGGKSDYVTQEN